MRILNFLPHWERDIKQGNMNAALRRPSNFTFKPGETVRIHCGTNRYNSKHIGNANIAAVDELILEMNGKAQTWQVSFAGVVIHPDYGIEAPITLDDLVKMTGYKSPMHLFNWYWRNKYSVHVSHGIKRWEGELIRIRDFVSVEDFLPPRNTTPCTDAPYAVVSDEEYYKS